MIYVANAAGTTDGVMYNVLNRINTEIPIVLVTRPDDFKFNEDLRRLDKYILVDMVENGWNFDWARGTHFFGNNTEYFADLFPSEEWMKFENFVVGNQPIKYLKREMLKQDATDYYQPINYPCWSEIPTPQTREDFNSRPFEVFFNFGISHEYRKELHGEIWKKSGFYGYSVCDNYQQLNGFLAHEGNSKKWLSIHAPHYYRLPIENVLQINGMAKISVSLPGAGRSCFRHAESPVNSVMLMRKDDMKWSYDWIDEVNCIKCEEGEEIATMIEYLASYRLYDIYLQGVENCKNYCIDNYINKYLLPIINSHG
jgi:hypothetical protein